MRIPFPIVFPILLITQAPLLAQVPSVEVLSIEFLGNEAFPEDSLSRTIVNRETRCRSFSVFWLFCPFGSQREMLNERELARDVLRLTNFYNIRGYRDVRIDTLVVRPSEDAVELFFQIQEGLPVRIGSLTVEVADVFEEFDPAADLPVQVGGLLNAIDLAATRDSLIQRFRNRGYPRADVSRSWSLPSEDPYLADVTFEVEPGPHSVFGPITFAGNEKLSDEVIRQFLPFEEGQEYSEVLTLEAQRNLFSIEMIRRASIVEAVDPAGLVPDSVVPLQVRITEAEIHNVRFGGGWSTLECGNLEGRWTSRNFYGGARRLQLRGRMSNLAADQLKESICNQAGINEFGGLNWLLAAEFSQPLIRRSVALGVNLFWDRQSVQDVFVREAVGVDLSLFQALSANTSVTFAYRPELTKLEAAAVFFCTSVQVCTPEDIASLQEPNWLAPVSVSLVQANTDNVLNPTRGYQVVLNFEHASGLTGSDFQYNRALGEATAYVATRPGHVLAARVRGGWIGAGTFTFVDVVHPQKRFFSGGANSVRGFAQNQLGPRVLTVDPSRLLFAKDTMSEAPCTPAEVMDLTCDANPLRDRAFGTPRPTGGDIVLEGGLEYRMAWGRSVEAAIFTDFGRIWTEPGSGKVSGLEISPGFGIRYLSLAGPIRVDFGYRFRGVEPLQVVTTQIRPFEAGDDPEDRISAVVGDKLEVLEYVATEDLAVFDPRVLYGPRSGFSLSRFQIHLSIGQAF
ncbi:MAG: BamA/TamA family outer membrane protein [Gemmatimonadetes bacterium]|nr:BamA/TamA family outer membrane protein [Gemmatimonadota bacterium]